VAAAPTFFGRGSAARGCFHHCGGRVSTPFLSEAMSLVPYRQQQIETGQHDAVQQECAGKG
jgi:hypothetical protein